MPKAVGVEADPKGGPRLQEAIMKLFHTHGMETSGISHSSLIHLLQSFQAVEVSVRQFYFSYQQLEIAVMGSGEYQGAVQTEISAAEALSQLYFEPSYFPSLDGAKTFLGNYWHHNPDLEEGAIMRELVEAKARSMQNGQPKVANTQGSSSWPADRDSTMKVIPETPHVLLVECLILRNSSALLLHLLNVWICKPSVKLEWINSRESLLVGLK